MRAQRFGTSTANVVVDRHRINAQLGAEAAHVQRLEAVGVDDPQCRLQDDPAVQGPSARGPLVSLHCDRCRILIASPGDTQDARGVLRGAEEP